MSGALVLPMLVVLLGACARPSAATAGAQGRGPTAEGVSLDTVRGVVRVVGASPMTAVLLATAAGDRVSVSGRATDALRRLAGLEVTATGRRTGARDAMAAPRGLPVFEADRFVVRASDGVPAHDGILLRQRDRWELLLDDGRRVAVAALPPSLGARVGRRVWLAGALEGAPVAYGVIE